MRGPRRPWGRREGVGRPRECTSVRGCRNSSCPAGGAGGAGKAAWKPLVQPGLREPKHQRPAASRPGPWGFRALFTLKGSRRGDHSYSPRLLFLHGEGGGLVMSEVWDLSFRRQHYRSIRLFRKALKLEM